MRPTILERLTRSLADALRTLSPRVAVEAPATSCAGPCGCELVGDIPSTDAEAHPFEPSWSGMVCEAMVLRDGYGDACGEPASAAVHAR